jgi:hypothetical protein
MNSGAWRSLQVGVYAPGTKNTTTVLSWAACGTSTVTAALGHPSSTAGSSMSEQAGTVSPTAIMLIRTLPPFSPPEKAAAAAER